MLAVIVKNITVNIKLALYMVRSAPFTMSFTEIVLVVVGRNDMIFSQ